MSTFIIGFTSVLLLQSQLPLKCEVPLVALWSYILLPSQSLVIYSPPGSFGMCFPTADLRLCAELCTKQHNYVPSVQSPSCSEPPYFTGIISYALQPSMAPLSTSASHGLTQARCFGESDSPLVFHPWLHKHFTFFSWLLTSESSEGSSMLNTCPTAALRSSLCINWSAGRTQRDSSWRPSPGGRCLAPCVVGTLWKVGIAYLATVRATPVRGRERGQWTTSGGRSICR